MKIIETEGIALKNYSLGEADKIILFLTDQSGLVRLTVRGAKRLRNRFGGRLEPFTVARLAYGQKEESELGRLLEIETVESYFHLARDLKIAHALAYFAEILIRITPPHEPNEKLYRMLRACLDAIAQTVGAPLPNDNSAAGGSPPADSQTLSLLVAYYEIWLLRLAGFFPDFRRCAGCRRSIADRTVYFGTLDARLECADCARATGNRHAAAVDSNLKTLMRAALALPPLDFARTAARFGVEIGQVENITHRLLYKLLEYQPDYWTNNFAQPVAAPSLNSNFEPAV